MRVQPGIEVFLKDRLSLVRSARVGAVVHPASILPSLEHTADVLQAEPAVRLTCLFGPQHGARGEKQDNMIESEHYRDPESGLPVHSLYSDTRRPTQEMLEDLDVLLFDLQDVGTRVYTFIHTLAYCMEACARWNKRLVVLDRPNPINGRVVEGNLLQDDCRSFVGLHPLPMRHGMTTGELALLYRKEFSIDCDLEVVSMRGWQRKMWFDETGLPWIVPSPNIPTLDSAVVYPGTVLVEGTNLSEGRGTTRPFEFIGADFVQASAFASHLNSLDMPGVRFRPMHFEPTFHKFAGRRCGGVQIHVLQREAFESYACGIAVLSAARQLYPESFAWREPPYEYEHERKPIEILCGSRALPQRIDAGEPARALREGWAPDVREFERRRAPHLLYQ